MSIGATYINTGMALLMAESTSLRIQASVDNFGDIEALLVSHAACEDLDRGRSSISHFRHILWSHLAFSNAERFRI